MGLEREALFRHPSPLIESGPKTSTRPKVLLNRLCTYIVPLFYALNVVSCEEVENVIFP